MLEKAWKSGLLPEPRLERSAVGPKAWRGGTGAWWEAPLEVLLRALREEADLNPLGKTMAWGQISRAVGARRTLQKRAATPSKQAADALAAPVVVLGQMRSGTTRVHRLLACDPRFGHTRLFETMSPVPRRGPDFRAFGAFAGLNFLHLMNPELRSVHPTSPHAPEEEFGLFSLCFHGAQYEAQWRIPSFAHFWEGRDTAHIYAEFRMIMQIIAQSRGAQATRPWLMKAPQFLEDPDSLIGAFPDARLICLERDPADVVASSASLVWNQMRVQSDWADRQWIGREWLRKTARRAARCRDFLERRPDVPRVHLSFDAVNADWRGEIRRVYQFLGMQLTAEVEARMAAYLQRAEKSGFRGHRYRLEDFGLEAAAVREACGASARLAV
jgi:hypothetical protein